MSNGFWNQVEGNWKQFIGSAREKWGDLTDNELEEIRGNRQQLVGKIQERYGIAQEEAAREVDEWADRLKYEINNS